MTIEDRLVLKLVPAKTPGECVLRPDDLASYLKASGLQGVLKFTLERGAVADVERRPGLDRRPARLKCALEEQAEVVGRQLIALNLEFFVRITFVIAVIRRIG